MQKTKTGLEAVQHRTKYWKCQGFLEIEIVPRRGIASETCGRVSVTILWKTVKERRIVTPENRAKLSTHQKFTLNGSQRDKGLLLFIR